MRQIVAEFAELVEDDVRRVALQPGACIVDFLDVAFGPGRSDDVVRIRHPRFQPAEPFLAHAGRQNRDASAPHDARDRHAATAVVPRRWPQRLVSRRIELASHDPGREARVRGQHLMRANHRKPVAERNDDGGIDSGERRRQHEVVGDARLTLSARVVVPMNSEQVERVHFVGRDAVDRHANRGRNQRRVGQLRKRRQHGADIARPAYGAAVNVLVDDGGVESQAFHCVRFIVCVMALKSR
jgi:hypothetical protein